MMFNLLRMARTLVSAEPDEVRLAACLYKYLDRALSVDSQSPQLTFQKSPVPTTNATTACRTRQ